MTASTVEPVAAHGVHVELNGRLTVYTAAPIWRSALDTLARNPDRPITGDASQVEYADGIGIALLFDFIRRDRPGSAKVGIGDLAPNLGMLVQRAQP
jgi:ABC-type transporter Mla MlaB component